MTPSNIQFKLAIVFIVCITLTSCYAKKFFKIGDKIDITINTSKQYLKPSGSSVDRSHEKYGNWMVLVSKKNFYLKMFAFKTAEGKTKYLTVRDNKLEITEDIDDRNNKFITNGNRLFNHGLKKYVFCNNQMFCKERKDSKCVLTGKLIDKSCQRF